MSDPITVVRHRCGWCRRTFASKSYAARHEASCNRNPASKTCATCAHFTRTPCCSSPSDDCGCNGLNDCAVGAFVTWKFDDHGTRTPKADGWWTHVEDYRRQCPSWVPVERGA